MRQREEERLYSLIEKYKKKMHLTDTAINVVIADNKVQKFRKRGRHKAQTDCFAEVVEEGGVSKEYTIFFFKDAFNKGLEDTVIHELAHILLWPMSTVNDTIMASIDTTSKIKNKLYNSYVDSEHKIIENIIKIVRDKKKKST